MVFNGLPVLWLNSSGILSLISFSVLKLPLIAAKPRQPCICTLVHFFLSDHISSKSLASQKNEQQIGHLCPLLWNHYQLLKFKWMFDECCFKIEGNMKFMCINVNLDKHFQDICGGLKRMALIGSYISMLSYHELTLFENK